MTPKSKFNNLRKLLLEDQKLREQLFETNLLVDMLSKSSELLSIGLGEAGKKIFKNHLSGKIENMLERGNKVFCIFGFCNLVGFRKMCENLDISVLKFVNKISNIVHRNVYLHLGYVNKNLGDVYFIVWKFKSNEIKKTLKEEKKNKVESKRRHSTPLDAENWIVNANEEAESARNKFDLALISFVKIYWEIKQRLNKKIKERFQNKIETEINMKFGLHCGWAIEGAIGSSSKIDTRYFYLI